MSDKKEILLAARALVSLAISEVSEITIVYNEHPAVPEEGAHNYIVEEKMPWWKKRLL